MLAVRFATVVLCLMLAAAASAQPANLAGVTTQISVQDQAPLDAAVSDPDGQGSVSITVQRPNGTTVDITVNWSWRRGVSTRRSIAEQIARDLKEQLRQQELPQDWVTQAGGKVIVTNTPKGVGKNQGTPKKPEVSPPGADRNSLHLETRTTDKDGK